MCVDPKELERARRVGRVVGFLDWRRVFRNEIPRTVWQLNFDTGYQQGVQDRERLLKRGYTHDHRRSK